MDATLVPVYKISRGVRSRGFPRGEHCQFGYCASKREKLDYISHIAYNVFGFFDFLSLIKENLQSVWSSFMSETLIDGSLVTIEIPVGNQEQPIAVHSSNRLPDASGSDQPATPDVYYRWCEAPIGATYGITIRLKDPTQRYSVGVAIDGRNVMDGQRVPFERFHEDSSWDNTFIINVVEENGGTIRGWRDHTGTEESETFVFTDTEHSVAANSGNPEDIGTIAIAVFRERGASTEVANSRSVGTGRGETRHDPLGLCDDFDSQSCAYEVFVLCYKGTEALEHKMSR